MSAPASLPVFGDAYLADTQHLTLEEHGAYFKLMLVAWRSPGCALPDDDRRIATMLGIGAKKWATLRPAVMAFWTLAEAGWQQKRLLKEYLWASKKAKQNSDAAQAMWAAKSLEKKKSRDANASANGNVPPPPPHKTQKDKPSGTRGRALPPDFEPVLTEAAQRVVDGWPPGMLDREKQQFRDHHAHKGTIGKDWQAAFRTWVANAEKWRGENNGRRNGNGGGGKRTGGFAASIRARRDAGRQGQPLLQSDLVG